MFCCRLHRLVNRSQWVSHFISSQKFPSASVLDGVECLAVLPIRPQTHEAFSPKMNARLVVMILEVLAFPSYTNNAVEQSRDDGTEDQGVSRDTRR